MPEILCGYVLPKLHNLHPMSIEDRRAWIRENWVNSKDGYFIEQIRNLLCEELDREDPDDVTEEEINTWVERVAGDIDYLCRVPDMVCQVTENAEYLPVWDMFPGLVVNMSDNSSVEEDLGWELRPKVEGEWVVWNVVGGVVPFSLMVESMEVEVSILFGEDYSGDQRTLVKRNVVMDGERSHSLSTEKYELTYEIKKDVFRFEGDEKWWTLAEISVPTLRTSTSYILNAFMSGLEKERRWLRQYYLKREKSDRCRELWPIHIEPLLAPYRERFLKCVARGDIFTQKGNPHIKRLGWDQVETFTRWEFRDLPMVRREGVLEFRDVPGREWVEEKMATVVSTDGEGVEVRGLPLVFYY
ncbi:hypothetical protein HDV00_007965 [Rhizophlyctis rosea]|nr:hypothetical protein HDV00_007965 [Rhizophlyctis rosea]